jgi:hypothetical protein
MLTPQIASFATTSPILLSRLEPTLQPPNPLHLTQVNSLNSKSESSHGEEAKPLAQENQQRQQQPKQQTLKSLETIEDEPFPDARIWRIKASELEQWRQVLSIAKKSVHRII